MHEPFAWSRTNSTIEDRALSGLGRLRSGIRTRISATTSVTLSCITSINSHKEGQAVPVRFRASPRLRSVGDADVIATENRSRTGRRWLRVFSFEARPG